MKNAPSNIAASIRQRLLNRARENEENFNSLLTRYGIERLLYRIGISSQASHFCLKGAHLFAAWTGELHRPTKDVDFLGYGSPDPEDVANRISKILSETENADGTNDGLDFNIESIHASEIREEVEYGGVRVKLTGELANARINLQIDVGFGDAVTPAPIELTLPTLLEDVSLPSPILNSYPQATAIAEKTEAMTSLGIANSRLKDFYDIWTMSRTFSLDSSEVIEAIIQTFQRRKTKIELEPMGLTNEFWSDKSVQLRWRAFAKKNISDKGQNFAFDTMVEELRTFLLPLLLSAFEGRVCTKQWNPKSQIWIPENQSARNTVEVTDKITVNQSDFFDQLFSGGSVVHSEYWITKQGKRHNPTCRYYKKTAGGFISSKLEGLPCSICGG